MTKVKLNFKNSKLNSSFLEFYFIFLSFENLNYMYEIFQGGKIERGMLRNIIIICVPRFV